MVIDGLEEGDIMADPVQLEIIERLFHRFNRDTAIFAPCAELSNHRVIEHRNLAAFIHASVVTDNCAFLRRAFRWRAVAHKAANGRQEIAIRVFRVNPRLERPAI